MKIISRYLLSNLFRPWGYILFGFSLIIILVDLFENFVPFMELGTPFRLIFFYYAVLNPLYWPFILPISLLLALLYAFWQLGKNSEIVAMRACGLSLIQLTRPYFIVGLLSSLFLLFINESFNPLVGPWARQFKDMQGKRDATVYRPPLAYRNVVGGRIWRAGQFDPRPSSSYELREISLIQQRPDGTDEYRVTASRGLWINDQWWFENVEMRHFTAQGAPDGPLARIPSMEMAMVSEKPADFLAVIKQSEERSSAEILNYLDKHPDISADARARLMSDFHYRLASPWLCLLVVFVGVPFGMHTGRRGMGLGILLALLIFFSYYVLMLLCLAWGKESIIPPVMAGWTPLLVFLVFGLVQLHRVR